MKTITVLFVSVAVIIYLLVSLAAKIQLPQPAPESDPSIVLWSLQRDQTRYDYSVLGDAQPEGQRDFLPIVGYLMAMTTMLFYALNRVFGKAGLNGVLSKLKNLNRPRKYHPMNVPGGSGSHLVPYDPKNSP